MAMSNLYSKISTKPSMKRFQDNVAVKQTNTWMNGERNKDSGEREREKERKRKWEGEETVFIGSEWVKICCLYFAFDPEQKRWKILVIKYTEHAENP